MKRYLNLISTNPLSAVIILGFIVRLIFLLNYISSPDWPQLLADSLFHDRWASAIASGNIIGQEVYFRAPFYVYILGFIYAVFGHSLLAARIFGHLVGLVSVAITYLLARRLLSKKTAVIAGIVHALYPVAIYFESELLVDSLFMMLLELSVLFFLITLEKQNLRWYILTGLVIGLAAITRPIVIALVPLYVIWIFINGISLKKAFIDILILMAAMILMIAPVALRNLIVADDFVPISSSGGLNFYIGNNSQADGLTATLPPPLRNNWGINDITFVAEQETGRKLKASEVSDFWYKKARVWIIEHPVDFIKLYIKKIYFMFNNAEISNNRSLALFFSRMMILKFNPINFGLIFSLAVMALIILIVQKRFSSPILFLALLIAGYTMVISLFFINARFRLPVIPFIIILSACGIERLTNIIYHKKFRPVYLFAVLGGIAVFVLSNSSLYNIRTTTTAAGFFNKANYYLHSGDYKKAVDYYIRTLAENDAYPDANLNLGAVYLKRGHGDSAEIYFRRELNRSPDNAGAYSNLASLYNLKGDFRQSQVYADSAIALKPYAVDPYLISLRNFSQLDDTAAFENMLTTAGKNLKDISRVYLDVGIIFSQWGEYDSALTYLQSVLDSPVRPMETNDDAFSYSFSGQNSDNAVKAQAAYQMGYIYGIRGNLEQSIAKSKLAIALDSNLADAYVNLINAYMLLGKQDDAQALLKKARQKFPDNKVLEMLHERFQ